MSALLRLVRPAYLRKEFNLAESESIQETASALPAPRRERLPYVRQSITHKFRVGELEGYVTVGLYPDGRPGEVFIKIAKHGSTVAGLVDTIAVLTSVALQYGVPLEQLVRKFEYTRFEPSGPTGAPAVRWAHSLVDYIFRWLGHVFSDASHEENLARAEHEQPVSSAPATENGPQAQGMSPEVEPAGLLAPKV